jgi:alpha-ketoglutarate-dependent taurine dioxygenase
MSTTALEMQKLTSTIGAEVLDVDIDRVRNDKDFPAAMKAALAEHGVLLFRRLNMDDDTQAGLGNKLGSVKLFSSGPPQPEVSEISLNSDNEMAAYLRGNVTWHQDGILDQDVPTTITMLSAKVTAPQGGETEYASSYAAYEMLSNQEKREYGELRVAFSYGASQRRVTPDPTPQQVADWALRPTREYPLVWTHETGRRSLMIGSTMDYVVGMDVTAGRALLEDLLDRATPPDRVYSHSWQVGDTVIWDNTGLYHRARPFDPGSRRRMHRTTILGTEPIR